MWKQFVICLCLILAIENLSAKEYNIDCCEIFEIVFKQKCTDMDNEFSEFVEPNKFICRKANNVELVSQISGLILNSNKDWNYCIRETKQIFKGFIWKYVKIRTERFDADCKVRVDSLTINTNETTLISQLNDVARHVPNITRLNWNMEDKCQRVNEITAPFKYLHELSVSVAGSVNLNKCIDFALNGSNQLTELSINLFKPENVTNYAINETFLGELKNLKELSLGCGSYDLGIDFAKNMFQGLRNLEELALQNCVFNNLSAEHFQYFTNLTNLDLQSPQFKDFNWLGSETLRNHLKNFRSENATSEANDTCIDDIKYIENFTHLETFSISPGFSRWWRKPMPSHDILPYACEADSCKVFRNRIGCPPGCNCVYEFNGDMHIKSNCTLFKKEIDFLIRFQFNSAIALVLGYKNLTKLPDTSFYNYSSINELYVAHNQLDNLTIAQLPQNLSYLDISNNRFQFLGSEIFKYLEQRNGGLSLKLSNNSWICDCYYTEFMKFLSKYPKMAVDLHNIKCNGTEPALMLYNCNVRKTYFIAIFIIFIIEIIYVAFTVYRVKSRNASSERQSLL